ncbi:hypothetical protein AGOR_G00130510 [Albula goreensis]|uniref:VWFC domain-containing protein n=1 Tax=Albula goreensis TaxID=1534307 RepID=A0A8T3D7P0_9TELE|nr:hypothetical protein AGOR_G00130510 [Albula goreensis]
MYSTVLLSLSLCAALCLAEGALQGRKAQKTKISRSLAAFKGEAPVRDGVPVLGRGSGAGSKQCVVGGLSLLEGAQWSTEPCSVCRCEKGEVNCKPVHCPSKAGRRPPSLSPKVKILIRTPPRRMLNSAQSKADDDDDDDDDDGEEEEDGEDVNVTDAAAGEHPSDMPAEGRGVTDTIPIGCLLSESVIACRKAGLTHMPILTDPNIKVLSLSKNKIKHIPPDGLAGLPNLEWLDLSKNVLSDSSLPPDLFRGLTKLKRLNLDGNDLTKIPLLPPSLEELKLNDNKIITLTPKSFAGLSKLLRLELEDNHFLEGSIAPEAFRPLRRLLFLNLDDNKLRSIPLGLPPSLQELRLSENKLEQVPDGVLNKSGKLRALDLSSNHIRDDRISPKAWKHLKKLEVLDLSHNKLLRVPPLLPRTLRLLSLHRNQVQRVPANVFGHMKPGLDALRLSHNHLRDDGVTAFSFLGLHRSLTRLYLDHNQLQAFPPGLARFKALEELRLDSNLIRYVPQNAVCDSRNGQVSHLEALHLEHNLIDRHLIPASAFSCLGSPINVLLEPQSIGLQE